MHLVRLCVHMFGSLLCRAVLLCFAATAAESNLYVALYMYAFLVIGAFFAVNLFVGVVIDKFNRMKEEYEGSAFQTREQKQWSDMQRLLNSIKPKVQKVKPENIFRRFFFEIVNHPKFDIVIMICIMLNTLTMMMEHYHQTSEYVVVHCGAVLAVVVCVVSWCIVWCRLVCDWLAVCRRVWSLERIPRIVGVQLPTRERVIPCCLDMSRWDRFLQVCNLLFVAVFAAEAVMKLIAFFPSFYFKENWNKFDCTVVVVSIIGLFVNAGVGANVVRVFRVARVFRLIKRAKQLNDLFNTLIASTPSLWNIGSLVFVLFFIFAVLGKAATSW